MTSKLTENTASFLEWMCANQITTSLTLSALLLYLRAIVWAVLLTIDVTIFRQAMVAAVPSVRGDRFCIPDPRSPEYCEKNIAVSRLFLR